MYRIIKIGMDVHSKNYTLCAMEPVIGEEDRIFANIQVTVDYKNILMFIEQLKVKLGMSDEYDIQCGYEAGCLGYSLYNQLTAAGVKCVILAPTTMLTQQGKRVKTDARDALMIAQCLSYGGYHAVYIPTQQDDSVKEYLRMRDDHKDVLKKIKQQINALCLRHGHHYEGTKWTIKHVTWLRKLVLEAWDKTYNAKEIEKYFSVNESTIYSLVEERTRTGSYETRTYLRGRKPILTEKQHQDILELVQKQPDITMNEIIEILHLPVGNEAVRRFLIKQGYTYKKKSLHAKEQERPRCADKTQNMDRKYSWCKTRTSNISG